MHFLSLVSSPPTLTHGLPVASSAQRAYRCVSRLSTLVIVRVFSLLMVVANAGVSWQGCECVADLVLGDFLV